MIWSILRTGSLICRTLRGEMVRVAAADVAGGKKYKYIEINRQHYGLISEEAKQNLDFAFIEPINN